MQYITNDTSEISQITDSFLKTLKAGDNATVVVLSGELGAGKTTFTKSFAERLGIKENVSSPTFVIERVYPVDYNGFKQFIHIDAYRMDEEKEIINLGWNELVDNKENLIFIEWGEKFENVIPQNALRLYFRHGDSESQRIIEIPNA